MNDRCGKNIAVSVRDRLLNLARELKDVCLSLEAFLLQPTQALVRDEEFRATWKPGGPWR